MQISALVVLALFAGAHGRNSPGAYLMQSNMKVTPIQKVIQLLNEMLAKGKKRKASGASSVCGVQSVVQ
jgi:hypothetical protein